MSDFQSQETPEDQEEGHFAKCALTIVLGSKIAVSKFVSGPEQYVGFLNCEQPEDHRLSIVHSPEFGRLPPVGIRAAVGLCFAAAYAKNGALEYVEKPIGYG